MAEKLTEKKETAKKWYPFGIDYRPEKDPADYQARYLEQPKPVLIEGTGDTKIDTSDKIDLVELTQSYADQCGVEWMMKQMKMGLVNPASVADDGQHSGDATILPEDQFMADNLAKAAAESKVRLCQELGLDPDKATENDIKAKVAEIYNKAAEAKPANPEPAKENE